MDTVAPNRKQEIIDSQSQVKTIDRRFQHIYVITVLVLLDITFKNSYHSIADYENNFSKYDLISIFY